MCASELFYSVIAFTTADQCIYFILFYSILPSVANEDAEGSTRPQASFARKYHGTTLNLESFMLLTECSAHSWCSLCVTCLTYTTVRTVQDEQR